MADWEEIKKLAADFQKVQLNSSFQRLSEKNVVEIINKIMQEKLLDLIFTNDGKEYVTLQQLEKEIKDELFFNDGRINMVNLAENLNVSLSQITKICNEIEKQKGFRIVLGQLIDNNYVQKLAQEINDKLNLNGTVNTTDLSLIYDLPAEFLQGIIEKNLDKLIFAKQDKQDPRIFYNEGFINKNKAKIIGALSAITKPTQVSAILGQCAVPEKIFFAVVDALNIPGSITGKTANSVFIPAVYVKTQNEFVENFYEQNKYLEFDALARLGISDPKGFIKKRFPKENLIFLNSVAINKIILEQLEANLEETNRLGSFLDVQPLLPSVFSDQDIEQLLKITSQKFNIRIFDMFVVSDSFLESLRNNLNELAERKAKDAISSGKFFEYLSESKPKTRIDTETKSIKKEERKKKGGKGNQRETKTKSTKRKYLQKNEEFSDEEEVKPTKHEIRLVSFNEVKTEISKNKQISNYEDLVEDLAKFLEPDLNKIAIKFAEEMCQKDLTTNLNDIEDKLNLLLFNIRLFEKGTKHFEKTDQVTLIKYLLKTLGNDFVNEVVKLAGKQNFLQVPENLTTENRNKIINELPQDLKEPLLELSRSLNDTSLENFFTNVENVMSACCLVTKKFDKKKEKLQVSIHRDELIKQLQTTDDPALILHLSVNILYMNILQSALHMSGRHVLMVLKFLQNYLSTSAHEKLLTFHNLVLKVLTGSDEETKLEAKNILDETSGEIKMIATNFKAHLKGEQNAQE